MGYRALSVAASLFAGLLLCGSAVAGSGAPALHNPGFECSQGYISQAGITGQVPSGWTARLITGTPNLQSARTYYTGSCNNDHWVEHLQDADALVFLAQDLETQPLPGKPFDAVIYQQVATTPGEAYSLSGWMVSLCGGSFNEPNDCPPGYYMAKMLGVDLAGGTDPLAPGTIWAEDRRNFNVSRWANLRVPFTAQSITTTLFVRVNSPFRWHGNHAFADAISLVRSPDARFVDLPASVDGSQAEIKWEGSQSPDVLAIPAGKYQLRFDVQVRRGEAGAWEAWQSDVPAGSSLLRVDTSLFRIAQYVRVRARAEQLETGGSWPYHVFLGVWSPTMPIVFNARLPGLPRVFLPLVEW